MLIFRFFFKYFPFFWLFVQCRLIKTNNYCVIKYRKIINFSKPRKVQMAACGFHNMSIYIFFLFQHFFIRFYFFLSDRHYRCFNLLLGYNRILLLKEINNAHNSESTNDFLQEVWYYTKFEEKCISWKRPISQEHASRINNIFCCWSWING